MTHTHTYTYTHQSKRSPEHTKYHSAVECNLQKELQYHTPTIHRCRWVTDIRCHHPELPHTHISHREAQRIPSITQLWCVIFRKNYSTTYLTVPYKMKVTTIHCCRWVTDICCHHPESPHTHISHSEAQRIPSISQLQCVIFRNNYNSAHLLFLTKWKQVKKKKLQYKKKKRSTDASKEISF
jgi:hypothetical protein